MIKFNLFILLFLLISKNLIANYVKKEHIDEANNKFIIINDINKNTKDKNKSINKKVYYLKLNNLNSSDLLKSLDIFENVKIKGQDNYLLINSNLEEFNEIKGIIEQIDIKKNQVLIKLNIIETTNNLFNRLGFSWKIKKDSNILSESFKNGKLSLYNLLKQSGKILDIDIDALKHKGEIQLKTSPSIVVLDGSQANFRITDENFYNFNKKENFSKEAGIIIKVTPRIKWDKYTYVELEIFSELSNFKTKQVKSKFIVDTKINVKNGATMFIASNYLHQTDNSFEKTPGFSEIPLFGTFFKKTSKGYIKKDIYLEIEVKII